MCVWYAAVFVFCQRLTTTMRFTRLKRWHRWLAARAVRATYLVLSLFLVLVRDPPLPVVAVRHFVRAHKLDTAKVFSSLGDDARHLGGHKQVHLKEADKKKEKKIFFFYNSADLKFHLWKHGWGVKNRVCCIYFIISQGTIYVKWIIEHCEAAQTI